MMISNDTKYLINLMTHIDEHVQNLINKVESQLDEINKLKEENIKLRLHNKQIMNEIKNYIIELEDIKTVFNKENELVSV